MKEKFLYFVLGALIAINITEFFFINSIKTTTVYIPEVSAANQFLTLSQFSLKEIEGCPNRIGGNPDAVLKIKYFYNDLCPYCRKEAPVLDSLINKRGSLFYIQMFDTDICREESIQEGVNRIPFFVFMANGEKKSGGGFVTEDDLEKFICDVTQGC